MSRKRTYHPLVLLCYQLNILDQKYINQIPRTTLNYWDTFSHEDVYGYNWVKDYINTDLKVVPKWKNTLFISNTRIALKCKALYY